MLEAKPPHPSVTGKRDRVTEESRLGLPGGEKGVETLVQRRVSPAPVVDSHFATLH